MWKIITLVALLSGSTGGHGELLTVEQRTTRSSVTVTALVYGFGPTHEISGSFVGSPVGRYFNADGMGSQNGAAECPGFRYRVQSSRQGTRVEVRIPRACLPGDGGRSVLVRLIREDPSEAGRGIYLDVDKELARKRR